MSDHEVVYDDAPCLMCGKKEAEHKDKMYCESFLDWVEEPQKEDLDA